MPRPNSKRPIEPAELSAREAELAVIAEEQARYEEQPPLEASPWSLKDLWLQERQTANNNAYHQSSWDVLGFDIAEDLKAAIAAREDDALLNGIFHEHYSVDRKDMKGLIVSQEQGKLSSPLDELLAKIHEIEKPVIKRIETIASEEDKRRAARWLK